MFLMWSVCVSFVFCRRAEKVPGQCAVLQRDGRFVYYLVRSSEWTHTHRWHKRHSIWNVTVIVTSQVTKKRASQKPTYDSLTRSLEDMKSHCLRNEVTKISMPRFVFSFPLWLSATLSVSRLLRLQFKKNVSFFFPTFSSTASAVAWIDWSGGEWRWFWSRCSNTPTFPSQSTVFQPKHRPRWWRKTGADDGRKCVFPLVLHFFFCFSVSFCFVDRM